MSFFLSFSYVITHTSQLQVLTAVDRGAQVHDKASVWDDTGRRPGSDAARRPRHGRSEAQGENDSMIQILFLFFFSSHGALYNAGFIIFILLPLRSSSTTCKITAR